MSTQEEEGQLRIVLVSQHRPSGGCVLARDAFCWKDCASTLRVAPDQNNPEEPRGGRLLFRFGISFVSLHDGVLHQKRAGIDVSNAVVHESLKSMVAASELRDNARKGQRLLSTCSNGNEILATGLRQVYRLPYRRRGLIIKIATMYQLMNLGLCSINLPLAHITGAAKF
jgi:hypothetical protein